MVLSLREKGSTRGLTLLELIITLVVIAIVLAIAYPSFNRLAINSNLRTAARDIISDIAALRGRAMAENTQFSVVFDVPNNRYTLPGLAQPKTPTYFGADIQITQAPFGAGTTIVFQTRGTLQQAGNIVLTNGRGSTATIRCNVAGRSHVEFNMR